MQMYCNVITSRMPHDGMHIELLDNNVKEFIVQAMRQCWENQYALCMPYEMVLGKSILVWWEKHYNIDFPNSVPTGNSSSKSQLVGQNYFLLGMWGDLVKSMHAHAKTKSQKSMQQLVPSRSINLLVTKYSTYRSLASLSIIKIYI